MSNVSSSASHGAVQMQANDDQPVHPPVTEHGRGAPETAKVSEPPENPACDPLYPHSDLFHHHVFPVEDSFFRSRVPRNTHWSVAWSDLMMTMFIFFVVMFVYQAAQRDFLTGEGLGSDIGAGMGTGVLGEGGGGGVESIAEPPVGITPLVTDLGRLIDTEEAAALRKFAEVELAPDRTVRIILTSDLLFDLGKAAVLPQARDQLTRIAGLIRRTPNMVNVIGHTDNIPMRSAQFPSNWELSVVRATAVTRYLIEEMKLPGNRFYVSGHSEYQPVAPNITAANRAANRRVEIVITREVPRGIPGTIGNML